MDLDNQTTEVKQEDERNETYEIVNTTYYIKLEQLDHGYGVQCDGFQVEPNLTTDTFAQVKMEGKPAVEFESEKPEPYMDSTKSEDIGPLELNEELDIKPESDSSTMSDPALDSATKKKKWGKDRAVHTEAERELFFCYHCNYAACSKMRLIQHINVGKCNIKTYLDKSQFADPLDVYVCTQCSEVFKNKSSLDQHLIKKHTDSVAAVSSEIQECANCDYRTTDKDNLSRHMSSHHSAVPKLNMCKHCNAPFRSKRTLDIHITRHHSKFIASLKKKIHECSYCTFKTTFRPNLKKHLTMHSGILSTSNLSTCEDCNVTFDSEQTFRDHIISKHPDITSVQTDRKHDLDKDLLRHPNAASRRGLFTCKYCNVTYRTKPSLHNHIIQKHPEFIASVKVKIYACSFCTFKTNIKRNFKEHMSLHPDVGSSSNHSTCKHCNITFTRDVALDNHIVRKHPELIASVKRKIHECSYCTFKSTYKSHLNGHMLFHGADSSEKLSRCEHCPATCNSIQSLDDHVVKKHPWLIASVTSEIHNCTYCTYKTTKKDLLRQHMLVHSRKGSSGNIERSKDCEQKPAIENNSDKNMLIDPAAVSNLNTCNHCTASFICEGLLNAHIIKTHPDFSASVSGKIHECTHCENRTTKNSSEKIIMCTHCDVTFKCRLSLDDHIVKKHTWLIPSVTSEIHNCTYCTYKTTIKDLLRQHMLLHSIKGSSSNLETNCDYEPMIDNNLGKHMLADLGAVSKLSTCNHCNVSCRSRQLLNEHIIKEHPDFSASLLCEIHECTHCEYRTTFWKNFTDHMLKHTRNSSEKLIMCTHCDATFECKQSLDDHIVEKHADCMASVTSQTYLCSFCAHTSVGKHDFDMHMLIHDGCRE